MLKGFEKPNVSILFTLIINIILNYSLIDIYGVFLGAVYATLISIIFSSIVYDFFDKDLIKYLKYKFYSVR